MRQFNTERNTYDIIPLPKEKWQGTPIPMRYTATEYYDVAIEQTPKGFQVTLEKKPFLEPVSHVPEEIGRASCRERV